MGDAGAVVSALVPAVAAVSELSLAVSLDPGRTRGKTVADLRSPRPEHGSRSLVDVVLDVDQGAIRRNSSSKWRV